jgi:hypothetical protein
VQIIVRPISSLAAGSSVVAAICRQSQIDQYTIISCAPLRL